MLNVFTVGPYFWQKDVEPDVLSSNSTWTADPINFLNFSSLRIFKAEICLCRKLLWWPRLCYWNILRLWLKSIGPPLKHVFSFSVASFYLIKLIDFPFEKFFKICWKRMCSCLALIAICFRGMSVLLSKIMLYNFFHVFFALTMAG